MSVIIKKNGLNENKSKIEDARYISSIFILLFLFQKMLNCLSDLDKGIKSRNYLVCIPKICYLRSANFALEFVSRKSSKTQKKNLY